MDHTGTLTFGCPGCLRCVYTAEPCSWDPGSVGLCSHSKKLTPGELRSREAYAAHQSLWWSRHSGSRPITGSLVSVSLDLAGPSPTLAPFHERYVHCPGCSRWQRLAGRGLALTCFPPLASWIHTVGRPGDQCLSDIQNLDILNSTPNTSFFFF